MQFKRIFFTTIYTMFLVSAGITPIEACGMKEDVKMACCSKADGACCSAADMNCCFDSNENEDAPQDHGAPAPIEIEKLAHFDEAQLHAEFSLSASIGVSIFANKNKAPPPKIYLLIHSLLFYDENVSLFLA